MSEQPEPIRVVYIAGSGRSGSTLLARVLGSAPGVFDAGELQRIWSVFYQAGWLCGCGEPLQSCEFWQAVIQHGLGSLSEQDATAYQSLHLRVARTRHVCRGWLPGEPEGQRRDLCEYQALLSRLYGAVAAVSGAKTIVDPSKGGGYGWVLGSVPGVRLSTINLVRDSRAVTNSWIHPRGEQRITSWTPRSSSLHWNVEQAFAESLRFRSEAYIGVRYEDFAERPKAVLDSIARRLSIPVPSVSEDGMIALTEGHALAGNRSRFATGTIAIRRDERWRQELDRPDALKVTALTWPLLLRHGYPLRLGAKSAHAEAGR